MTHSPKRHLLVTRTKTACGLKDPKHWTFLPREVTCQGCSKTLAMADAEVRGTTKQAI
jgi:hypothetical protein